MVKFIEVDPNEIDNIRRSRRGRVSYPILKGFLETGMYIAELDTMGMQQSKQSLSSSLTAYIRNHDMPIKLFQRAGKMYLMRLDLDEDGNEIVDWQANELQKHLESQGPPTPVTAVEVEKRFDEEKDKTTK